ncbi:carbohydrate sulfotransferase 11-like [Pecten maximus]|uniref:carbohydrate sulfotransferase 11-like n=1 Tax=Pecten maximus TaxID=6579 RepID=UPI00145836A6|nr:carbohydrate sulfotransferase 11-like [Pecten maximus]
MRVSLLKGFLVLLAFISLALFFGMDFKPQQKDLPQALNLVNIKTNSDEKNKQKAIKIKLNNNTSPMKDVYKVRRDRITKMCAENRSKFVGRKGDTLSRIIIDRKQRLAYCAVQKSASTFWKRVFRIVNGESNANSPFLPSVSATLTTFDSLRLLPENQRAAFTEKALSFMFVREPFGRLFSGYVDKLFSPNVIFWKAYGAFAVSVVRKNPSRMDLKCGHDVTFREFVKTVLYDENYNIRRNGHFTPQYEHCDICHYKYDIIGKLESLSEDTFYLLDRMGKTRLRKSLENDFHGQTLNDTIYDQVKLLFLFRNRFRECGVSFFEAQKLMWKKFQIRGIISKNSKYPTTREKSERMTREILTELIHKGIGDARDKNVAKQNKNDALLEAFSTLDREDMDRLSKMFEPDCELFDYDCRPSKLFDINSPIKPWYFDINTA